MKETDLIPESEPGDVSPTAGLMSAQVAMVNLVKYRNKQKIYLKNTPLLHLGLTRAEGRANNRFSENFGLAVGGNPT